MQGRPSWLQSVTAPVRTTLLEAAILVKNKCSSANALWPRNGDYEWEGL